VQIGPLRALSTTVAKLITVNFLLFFG